MEPPTEALETVNPHANPRLRDETWRLLQAIANGASLRGLIAVVAGSIVLLTPDATTALVQILALATFSVAGLQDLYYAIAGKRWVGKRIGRVHAAFRGLAGTLLAAFLLYVAFWSRSTELSVALIAALTGLYVAIRGVAHMIAAVRRRKEEPPGLHVAAGAIATVGGVIAFMVPEYITDAVIITLAIASIIVGAIVVAWGIRHASGESDLDPRRATVAEVLWDWIRMSDVGRKERAAQADGLYFEEPGRYGKLATWWVMLLLSVAIATFAVLADSTAVVIGAMLVAPLMTPIVGLAGALVNGWKRRALHSAVLVGLGVTASVLLALGLSRWAPVFVNVDTNTQIVSRVNPTALDMVIALAAGAAGAFATVNTRVASGIAGVAIAVALVPPLSVVGITLGEREWSDALGAMLLFLTNFVAIVLAAGLVFVATGFARPYVLRNRPRQLAVTVAPFVVLAGIILLPLLVSSTGQLQTSSQTRKASTVVDDWLGPDTEFVVASIDVTGPTAVVRIVGPGEPPSASDLQDALVKEIGRSVGLDLVVTPVVVTHLDAPAPSGPRGS